MGDTYVPRFWPPFFTLAGSSTIFLGYFFSSTNTKTIFWGIKTTNSYRIRSFRPQISFFPRSFWVQFSAASGTPPSFFGPSTPPGALSFRFLQGLPNLTCNKLRLKTNINFSFFALHRHDSKPLIRCKIVWFNTRGFVLALGAKRTVFHNFLFNSITILPISLFLFDNDTNMASLQNAPCVWQWEAYFGEYFMFCIKKIPVFSFSSQHR